MNRAGPEAVFFFFSFPLSFVTPAAVVRRRGERGGSCVIPGEGGGEGGGCMSCLRSGATSRTRGRREGGET